MSRPIFSIQGWARTICQRITTAPSIRHGVTASMWGSVPVLPRTLLSHRAIPVGQMVQQDPFAKAAVADGDLVEAEEVEDLAREQSARQDHIGPGGFEADDLAAPRQGKGTKTLQQLLDPSPGKAVAGPALRVVLHQAEGEG